MAQLNESHTVFFVHYQNVFVFLVIFSCTLRHYCDLTNSVMHKTHASAFLIFYLVCCAMKRCLIAAKIAGSFGILQCCALSDVFI